jgi:hypothetical protein
MLVVCLKRVHHAIRSGGPREAGHSCSRGRVGPLRRQRGCGA